MPSKYDYHFTITHEGLGKIQTVKGYTYGEAKLKAEQLQQKWEAEYEKKVEAQKRAESKRQAEEYDAEMAALAQRRTDRLTEIAASIESFLGSLRTSYIRIDWESLKDYRLPGPGPQPPTAGRAEPNGSWPRYSPQRNLATLLSKKSRVAAQAAAAQLLEADHAQWRSEQEAVERQHAEAMSHWQTTFDTLVAEREQHNITIDAMRRAISTGAVPIANAAFEVLLSRVPWPVSQPSAPRAFMNAADRLLVIDIALPAPNDLPSVKAVTYAPRTKSLSEKPLTKSEADALYQSLAYQYVLAVPFVIFTEILPALVDTIVVNGWVTSVDAQTGHDVTACILSVSVRRSEWEGINLSRVDPKECFRGLKGIGSAQLRNLTPIPPIMRIDTSDPRFVESREVLDGMDSAQNLAVMDWADFEHLIRELFAKEFDVAGGKVEVTQASRDGGVDAVAFDPDPIRGGKIIIQAKRYANTVGVSYVRDLYGTVVNEGATKGILVTTSGFGSDAYEFAKDKPLTLLGGSELLFLLQKHGYSARIDLAEARTLNEQNRR